MASKRRVGKCVVVSDLHSGCQLALMPPVVRLDEGGPHYPHSLQKPLWQMWLQFWNWVEGEVDGEPWHLVLNGDAINGIPHGSIGNWSNNMACQVECAYQLLKEKVEQCVLSGGKFFMVRGTEAHVGKSAEFEEILAQRLHATGNDRGKHSRWELWLELDRYLIHFLHHIGTTSSMAYESSALMAELTAMLAQCASAGERPPDVLIRSHRHRAMEVRKPAHDKLFTVATTPSWQLKTGFAYKVPGARVSTPEIGGLIVCVGDEGIYTKQKIWHIKRTNTEQ